MQHLSADTHYVVRVLDDPGPIKLTLAPGRHTVASHAPIGSWCLQARKNNALERGILRNVDQTRGSVIPPAISCA